MLPKSFALKTAAICTANCALEVSAPYLVLLDLPGGVRIQLRISVEHAERELLHVALAKGHTIPLQLGEHLDSDLQLSDKCHPGIDTLVTWSNALRREHHAAQPGPVGAEAAERATGVGPLLAPIAIIDLFGNKEDQTGYLARPFGFTTRLARNEAHGGALALRLARATLLLARSHVASCGSGLRPGRSPSVGALHSMTNSVGAQRAGA